MIKVVKYLVGLGRRQAYAEIVAQLELLAVDLPRTREGQRHREPINEIVSKLKTQLKDGEA